MKKFACAFVSLILVLSMLMAIPASAVSWGWSKKNKFAPSNDEYAFSFACVGDTQILATLDANTADTISSWKYETENYLNKGYIPNIYNWIADNVEEKKIAYVFGLGDITQNYSNEVAKKEWEAIDRAWTCLDGKVPYSLVRGNHDGVNYYAENVCTKEYLAQFDGIYSNGKATDKSTYKKLDIAGMKFLLISLDFEPDENVIKWAESLIRKNYDRKVIISTHGYLRTQEERSSFGDTLWNSLVKKYKNIIMVLCGHEWANPIALRTVEGNQGNTVYEIMINPQEYDMQNAPSGMVAMMYFSNDGTKCWMEYYSTVTDFYCKLDTTELPFDKTLIAQTLPPKTTSAPETTTVPETTATPDVTEDSKSGCGALIFIPALPISVGCTAFALRKKRKIK